MNWRSTPRFVCQSWTVALASFLGCGIGLAQVGLGAWLWIFSKEFKIVLGEPMRNAFVGYMIIGCIVFLTCLMGVFSALLRNKYGMLLYAVFSLASIGCQTAVWAFVYLELTAVSEVITERIQERTEYYGFFTREFNCHLQVQGIQFEAALVSCATFVAVKMWTIVWVMFGLCAVLVCLQLILMILASMLFVLISEELSKSKLRVSPAQNESILLPSYNSRTMHFFKSSSQNSPETNQARHKDSRDEVPFLITPVKLTTIGANATAATTNNKVNIQIYPSTSSSGYAKPSAGLLSSVSPLSGTNPFLIHNDKSNTMTKSQSKLQETSTINRHSKVQVSPRNGGTVSPRSMKVSSSMDGRAASTKQQTYKSPLSDSTSPPRNGGTVSPRSMKVSSSMDGKQQTHNLSDPTSPPSLVRSDKSNTKSHFSRLVERLAPSRHSKVQASPRNRGKVSPTPMKASTDSKATPTKQQTDVKQKSPLSETSPPSLIRNDKGQSSGKRLLETLAPNRPSKVQVSPANGGTASPKVSKFSTPMETKAIARKGQKNGSTATNQQVEVKRKLNTVEV